MILEALKHMKNMKKDRNLLILIYIDFFEIIINWFSIIFKCIVFLIVVYCLNYNSGNPTCKRNLLMVHTHFLQVSEYIIPNIDLTK